LKGKFESVWFPSRLFSLKIQTFWEFIL
jgi:hypothetical protein